jgi:uncharacterized peroxidase-related enzyme
MQVRLDEGGGKVAKARDPRIALLDEECAEDSQLRVLAQARQRYGWLPNTIRAMARSASAANIYLDACAHNEATGLSARERELIAVLTAEHNSCEYCLAAHGVKAIALGASRDEVLAAGGCAAADPRAAAILKFARAVLQERGSVADEQISAARAAGLDEGLLIDIVAVVAENVLGNYVNNVAGTPVDELVQRAARRQALAVGEELAA